MTEIVLVLLAVLVIAVVAYAVLWEDRRAPASDEQSKRPAFGGQTEVTLPVDDADPESQATKRLVADAAARVFARDLSVACVVVLARSGRELGRLERAAPEPRPFVDAPSALSEPPARRHAGPHEPVGPPAVGHAPANVRFQDTRTLPHLPLAAHFELSDRVKALIRNDEDPVDIVRAILEASDRPFHTAGNIFRRDDVAVIVLHTPLHVSVEAETLNTAFLAFERSGAVRGAVVTAGALHVLDVRRREALAPRLLHASVDGIQRMADAVAIGADPFEVVVFAA